MEIDDGSKAQTPEEAPETPILRREAIVVAQGRARLAFLFAMCTLAGVAMGFGLRGVGATQCPMAVERSAAAIAKSQPAPRTLSCDQGCTWLGIQMIDTREGVRIVKFFEGTPAAELAEGGLLGPGDFIHSVSGQRVRSAHDVIRQIRRRAPGDEVSMRLRRPGQDAVVMLEAELGWITGQQYRDLQ